jgi:hypothetical protein
MGMAIGVLSIGIDMDVACANGLAWAWGELAATRMINTHAVMNVANSWNMGYLPWII